MRKTLAQTAVAIILAAFMVMPALARKGQERSAQAIGAATASVTISGVPLTIVIGEDQSFQAENSDIPGVGQIFPSSVTGPADMGWFVQDAATLYAPDFANHAITASAGLGAYTAFTAQSQSAVSGDGSFANPYTVTTTSSLGTSGLTATDVVTYVNGDNFFVKQFTLQNESASTHEVRIFLAGDIFLADSDQGIPYFQSGSSSPGGQDCASPASYFILLIPQTPATSYTGAAYADVWVQIGTGQLSGSLTSSSCIDNGAGLQWNRTLAAGDSATITVATSFGNIPLIATFNVSGVSPGQGAQGETVSVSISGSFFQAETSFDFGAGIALSDLVITGPSTATANLHIDASAAIGLRDVIGLQSPGGPSDSLLDGFEVVAGIPPGTPGATPAAPVPASGTLALGSLLLLLLLAATMYRRRCG